MYELNETPASTAPAIKRSPLIRLSTMKKEQVRFFAADVPMLVRFGELGEHPITSGYVYRTTGKNPGRPPGKPSISLKLMGFDVSKKGTEGAVLGGIWGPEYHMLEARQGRMVYRGTFEALPEELVENVLNILDGRGAIDLEPSPLVGTMPAELLEGCCGSSMDHVG